MPIGTTGYGDVNPEVAGYLSKKMLVRALELMAFERFVTGETLPEHETKTIRMRRFVGDWDMAVDNMYLTEGEVPVSQQLQQEDVTLTLVQMGGIVKITDVVHDTHTSKVLNEAFDVLSDQAPRIVETDRFFALRAITNKYFANGTARSAVNTPISVNLLKKAERNLQRNLALPITKIAKTSPDFNTEPIHPAYPTLTHIDTQGDIEGLTGFVSVKDYPSSVKPYEGEIGSRGRLRFILTTMTTPYKNAGGAKGAMISTGGTSADVYPVFIFGQNAWDSVALKGKFAIKPMVVSPDSIDHANPMGQFGYASWKTMQGTLIKNDEWCVLLEVAATELS